MATLAQLQAEQWWAREIVPEPINWMASSLCAHYRLPAVRAGAKGDHRHLRGAHRSQEWIIRSRYCTDRSYTVVPGLTAEQARACAGFDFTPGSTAEMIRQCKRLDAALRAGRLEEVVEFYGSLGGDRIVDGWDNIHNRRSSADDSHLWHWHLSLHRKKITMAVVQKIFAVVTGQIQNLTTDDEEEEEEEEDMPQLLTGNLLPGKARVLVIPPVQGGTAGWGRAWLALGSDFGTARVRAYVHDGTHWRAAYDKPVIDVASGVPAQGVELPKSATKVSLRIEALDPAETTVVGYRVEYAKA